jgi:hypothetical protein
MNDIVALPFNGWNPAGYEQALRDEFDQLYEEGAHRRRMMVARLHDRISGHAGRVRALDRFLTGSSSGIGLESPGSRRSSVRRQSLPGATERSPTL